MQDSSLLKTKQVVIKKMHQLLVNLNDQLRPVVLSKIKVLPTYALSKSGKISKGENYRDLPYLVLDFPRHFSQDAIFAFRTMFWWGNFLSCTLHLQGSTLERFRSNLMGNLPHADKDVFFCIAPTPWEYHYEKNNFLPINEISKEELSTIIKTKEFIKISRKLPLEKYDQLATFAIETFEIFWKLIASEERSGFAQ